MKSALTVLTEDPDARLAAAISRFEPEFSYPLGPDARFHVAHDGNGWRFFQAMGEGAYVVAEHDGWVRGILGAALRTAAMPDGSSRPVVYLGDLKITADARGGMTMLRLARAIQARFQARTDAAYAVVMDGTTMIPSAYTGRLGIPPFAAVGTLAVLWLHTGDARAAKVRVVNSAHGEERFATLAAEHLRPDTKDPALRSLLPPRWLVSDDGNACGRLEDTLRAKRLCSTTGEDMRSAHLSCFSYRDVRDGARLLHGALAMAQAAGYPMLFTALPRAQVDLMRPLLGDRIRTCAPATIYATGIPSALPWTISTADI